MTVAVIQFGGSNCDRDTVKALEYLGIEAELVWYADGLPPDTEGIVLPGGFSYGDYLRAGAMAAQAPIMEEIRTAVAEGVGLLGICNGAQIGCESGLAPGAFTVNRSARFQCEHVQVRIESTGTPWTEDLEVGEVLTLPIAHREGRYEIPESQLATLEREDRILCRYCEPDGTVSETANPNGSRGNVAGVIGERSNVAVLMPHPERATLPYTAGEDGTKLLTGFAAG